MQLKFRSLPVRRVMLLQKKKKKKESRIQYFKSFLIRTVMTITRGRGKKRGKKKRSTMYIDTLRGFSHTSSSRDKRTEKSLRHHVEAAPREEIIIIIITKKRENPKMTLFHNNAVCPSRRSTTAAALIGTALRSRVGMWKCSSCARHW